MSISAGQSAAPIGEHIGMFEAVLTEDTTLPRYLHDYLSDELTTDTDIDLLESHLHNGFVSYIDDADAAELASLYGELDLTDLEQAVTDHAVPSTYVESILHGALPVAKKILHDEGYPVDMDVDILYDPDATVGGKFDWETNTVRIGQSPDQLSFSPSILGLLVHELGHVHQFQEQIDAAVDAYNELVRASPVTPMDAQVTDDDEQYIGYGLLMMLDPRERLYHLFDLAESAYVDHPEHKTDIADYLAAAAEYEAQQIKTAEDALQRDRYHRSYDSLFTWEDEALPHALYIETDRLAETPEQYEEYLDTVIGSYTHPEQLQALIENTLGE